jgi:hypothetical protein
MRRESRVVTWVSVLAIGLLVVAGCGGGGGEETTTTTTVPLSAEETEFLTVFAIAGGADLEAAGAVELGHSVCRTLRLLNAAGVPGALAADAIREVDLAELSAQELGTYGAALAAVAGTLCPEVAFLATDTAYWLGL